MLAMGLSPHAGSKSTVSTRCISSLVRRFLAWSAMNSDSDYVEHVQAISLNLAAMFCFSLFGEMPQPHP